MIPNLMQVEHERHHCSWDEQNAEAVVSESDGEKRVSRFENQMDVTESAQVDCMLCSAGC